jgi:di/tricarboxylate transporter
MRVVVPPRIDAKASDIQLRTRYGLNLLAISRQGRRSVKRLRSTAIKAGDVLLMQGDREALSGFSFEFGCVPLATRDIRVPQKRQALAAALIMGAAICASALNLLPTAVSFAAAVLVFLALRIVPPRTAYQVVDWPVVVLLASMLPVAGAMASTGAADLIARFLLANRPSDRCFGNSSGSSDAHMGMAAVEMKTNLSAQAKKPCETIVSTLFP